MAKEQESELTSREVERQILQIQLLIRRQEHTEDDSVQLRRKTHTTHTLTHRCNGDMRDLLCHDSTQQLYTQSVCGRLERTRSGGGLTVTDGNHARLTPDPRVAAETLGSGHSLTKSRKQSSRRASAASPVQVKPFIPQSCLYSSETGRARSRSPASRGTGAPTQRLLQGTDAIISSCLHTD